MTRAVDVRTTYCYSTSAILKFIELIFGALVLCLLLIIPSGEGEPRFILGEEFGLFTAVFTMFFTLIFLFVHFLGCHRGWCASCSCYLMAVSFYIFAAMCWFITAGVETWMTTRYLANNSMTRYRMRASASAFSYANGLLYIVSAAVARSYDV